MDSLIRASREELAVLLHDDLGDLTEQIYSTQICFKENQSGGR